MKPLPLLSLSFGTLLLFLALAAALKDGAAPELYLEAPTRVPADLPFDLFVSANEPSTFRVRYGTLELERVAQDLRVSLLALAGLNEITIEAEDGAGNSTTRTVEVLAVPAVEATLEAPASVPSGDPFTVTLDWSDTGAELIDVQLIGNGGEFRTLRREEGLLLLGAAPLALSAAPLRLEARLVDEFGRSWAETRILTVTPPAGGVQELNIPAATLGVITDDGRELERSTLERAYSEAVAEPLWSEPFVMPIEGISTSGFALARRYAPGGPVSFHQGSDVGAPMGTEIRATNAGIVRVAGMFPIKGGLVVIDHGFGVFSLYFHQSEIVVAEGDRVERGQVIGKVGSTGLSTGPHLHWEMHVDGRPTNPIAWVGRHWP